jgi:hypothetical protein
VADPATGAATGPAALTDELATRLAEPTITGFVIGLAEGPPVQGEVLIRAHLDAWRFRMAVAPVVAGIRREIRDGLLRIQRICRAWTIVSFHGIKRCVHSHIYTVPVLGPRLVRELFWEMTL